MKKSFFYFAAGALALTACTSQDVVDDAVRSQNVIGFENVVNKISRADDITNSQFKSFYVYGYYNKEGVNFSPVFENVLVSRLSTNDGWTYKTTTEDYRYWIPGAKYHFYAYSCGDGSQLDNVKCESLDDGTSSFYIANYICDATHQTDLIFAFNSASDEKGIEGKESANQDVALNFTHLLSKVNATFSSGFPKGYEVQISNVTIRNIADQGSFLYQPTPAVAEGETKAPTHVWSAIRVADDANVVLWAESDPISVKFTDTAATNTMDSNSAYVIPNRYNDPNVTINFTIDVKDQDTVIMHKDLIGYFQPTWLPGYTYTYNIVVDGNAAKLDVIGFTTTVDEEGNIVAADWGGTDTTDTTINFNKTN